MTARPLRLHHVDLTVSDLPRAIAFYTQALGFTALAGPRPVPAALLAALKLPGRSARLARLRLGEEEMGLIEFAPPGHPYPPDSTATDIWFQHFAVVASDMPAAYARVVSNGDAHAITEGGPQRLPASSGGVTAWKFRDFDGHPLELIAFPPEGGPEVWRGMPRSAVTLGIDHSAISVADAAASIAFYETRLGFTPRTRQENYGKEQDRLDGLSGAHTEVVTLTSTVSATPHVELLAYSAPIGRPIPGTTRPDDVAATRLVCTAARTPISPGSGERRTPSTTNHENLALIRDPDGHLILLPSED